MGANENSTNKEKPSNKSKKHRIIIYGLVVHFILLFAVFDIYFSSPLDRGMRLIKSTNRPPAKRLVLFVADGLRAEAVYGKNIKNIPFLAKVKEKGSWGTAHTRVPTESRPGHVAMLAGIYEDPSAIFKGWQANPVSFDSVLNQSTNAWCWGSPDILKLFKKDNEISQIRINTYEAEKEDFGDNSLLLDEWVFTRVEKFLETIETCKDCEEYHKDGNVFFLHLLGIDTAGHGFKPNSKEYTRNIKYVDENIEKISQLFERTFKDEKTVFVFTSDHGMTDWGSHGSGSPHETEAPIIAWGAGIKRHEASFDINQIDVAPLLSTLVGLNIPSNSLGIIPLDFLDLPEDHLANIALSNTFQLMETFNIKKNRTEKNALVFFPFRGLTTDVMNEELKNFVQLRESQRYSSLISRCSDMMKTLITGLDYYHNYYQYPLLICISVGLIEWIFYLLTLSGTLNFSEHVSCSSRRKNLMPMVILLPITLCYLQKMPLSYYVHFTFPWILFCMLEPHLVELIKSLSNFVKNAKKKSSINVLIYIVGIELLVFAFFNRFFISVLCLLIGAWIFFADSLRISASNDDKIIWFLLSAFLSIFPMFPVMNTTFNVPFYILGSLTWICLFLFMLRRLQIQHRLSKIKTDYKIFYIQFLTLILAVIYNISIEFGLIPNNSNFKYVSWFLFIIPIAIIPFSSKSIATRLLATFFGFAPFYLLVSSNLEAVFSAIYVANLYNWLYIESKTFQSSSIIYFVSFDSYESKEKTNSEVYRRAFLFMVYIFVGFFGTGNIASLNSFDPMWVRAFLTVFSPFKMMGLILIKIMVPFLFACCVFRAINSIGKENILQMFSIILFFSDLMVLQFLYLITNKGSWLDIGSSLSHFIIMEAFVTILLLLYGFAHFLTTSSYFKSR